MPDIDAKKIEELRELYANYQREFDAYVNGPVVDPEKYHAAAGGLVNGLFTIAGPIMDMLATPSLAGEDVKGLLKAVNMCRSRFQWIVGANQSQEGSTPPSEYSVAKSGVIQCNEIAALARSLSSRVEEAEREREDARVERGNIAEDYRELETKLRNTFADAQSMKHRAEAAETRSAELARALNELIIAADSLATTANLSQADREIDRAISALAGHDAAIRAGGDDA